MLYSVFLDGYQFGSFLEDEDKTITFHLSGHLNIESYLMGHGHSTHTVTQALPKLDCQHSYLINPGICIHNAMYLWERKPGVHGLDIADNAVVERL